ncbi:GNAT family N-acetyltransferase [Microvirga lotononidis]|uniref:Sortase-like acyltransferase n=1 Tax=Microvirga lotononidis TaxID=864069 RepID=I4YMV0_9HYPH|nr:GNAT family N-acetyltransferase [Microvirga lotononidis]EIM25292.1 sortase-like acyltransferase [Microvirga lotononidis]WQO29231.1 N-acetyltransferase family protein [Microvirga lotononidis]
MSILVRPSSESDLEAVTAIYGHAVRHGTASFELDPPDRAEMARRRATILEGGYPYLVAEQDGAILGYAYAGAYRTRPAYRSTVEDSIYVAPSAQGQGIGRLLLAALIEECEARDFRLMVAVIGDEESKGSIGLHRSLGFEPVGILKGIGYKHGRWLSTVLMQRPLGRGTREAPTRPIA